MEKALPEAQNDLAGSIKSQRKAFWVSLAVVLFFIAVVLFYIDSPIYLGPYPIGIIAGICILLQLAMLFLSVKSIAPDGYRLKKVITIIIDVVSIIGIGYFFIIWWMTI